GCGPGYCSTELAYITGKYGKVIAVDKSKAYIDFLDAEADLHGLNIETQNCDFDEMKLHPSSLDGVYSRWALAWIKNPREIVEKIVSSMASGAVFVAHEYYDWSTLQSEPPLSGLAKGIATTYKSFKEQEGDIDIGRYLPAMFSEAGLELISVKPMAKLVTPDDLGWHWPRSFFSIFLPKLVEYGRLTEEELEEALSDIEELSFMDGSSINCPLMVEVIGVKP
ncbi:MAG: methyltransferase domain-containing protein, partial [Bacteroidia bacterium]|nr:methyltransferase domain-containing protein [Bacteroidia bacterium]